MAAGILASSLWMWQSSNATFTATTVNSSNTFTTGAVVLGDNDSATSMFAVTGLTRGSTGSACIKVSYSGSLAANVRLYGASFSETNSLGSYITFQVEETTGNGTTTFPSCAGIGAVTTLFNSTLSSFSTTYTNFGNGLSAWAPSASASRDYRFTYTVSASAPNSTMNSTAAITLIWEAQNT